MSTPATTDPRLGAIFAGRYRIVALLGEGGMGNVYRAERLDEPGTVALKILHEDLCDDPEVEARFLREMHAARRVEHPNTVRVHEHGRTPEGTLFLAMETAPGRPLSERLRDGPLPVARAVRVGRAIAAALAAAHREGILHRDLKPENVAILARGPDRDVVKVLDFGLALFVGADGDRLTAMGARVGTPLYMPPEYVSSYRQDHRGDLYALGMVLFEMLAGRPPWTGNPYEILHKSVHEPVPSPSAARGEPLPPALEALVRRLLAKDPAARPASAEAVERALARIERPTTRSALVVGLVLAVVLVLGVLALNAQFGGGP